MESNALMAFLFAVAWPTLLKLQQQTQKLQGGGAQGPPGMGGGQGDAAQMLMQMLQGAGGGMGPPTPPETPTPPLPPRFGPSPLPGAPPIPGGRLALPPSTSATPAMAGGMPRAA